MSKSAGLVEQYATDSSCDTGCSCTTVALSVPILEYLKVQSSVQNRDACFLACRGAIRCIVASLPPVQGRSIGAMEGQKGA